MVRLIKCKSGDTLDSFQSLKFFLDKKNSDPSEYDIRGHNLLLEYSSSVCSTCKNSFIVCLHTFIGGFAAAEHIQGKFQLKIRYNVRAPPNQPFIHGQTDRQNHIISITTS